MEKQNISMQLKGIELLNFHLDKPKEPIDSQTTFTFNINIEHRINKNKKLIIVTASIAILHEQKNIKMGSFSAACTFEISNIEDFITTNDNQVNIPEQLIFTLNSVTLSTVRGMMFSQFRGTFLHNAVLPLADVRAINTQ
ncbi:MAG: hypothetical protein JEZ03_17700 [Bacteroidales bacterium]|nr:hypothetical protein [Bacteroidales bacterium]